MHPSTSSWIEAFGINISVFHMLILFMVIRISPTSNVQDNKLSHLPEVDIFTVTSHPSPSSAIFCTEAEQTRFTSSMPTSLRSHKTSRFPSMSSHISVLDSDLLTNAVDHFHLTHLPDNLLCHSPYHFEGPAMDGVALDLLLLPDADLLISSPHLPMQVTFRSWLHQLSMPLQSLPIDWVSSAASMRTVEVRLGSPTIVITNWIE